MVQRYKVRRAFFFIVTKREDDYVDKKFGRKGVNGCQPGTSVEIACSRSDEGSVWATRRSCTLNGS